MRLALLLLILITKAALGQTTDSIKQKLRQAKYKVIYEFNQKSLELPPGYRFYARDSSKSFESVLINSNIFRFNELPDSFAIFVLEFGTTKIETMSLRCKRLGADATIIFGIFNNLDEIINLQKLARKEEKKD